MYACVCGRARTRVRERERGDRVGMGGTRRRDLVAPPQAEASKCAGLRQAVVLLGVGDSVEEEASQPQAPNTHTRRGQRQPAARESVQRLELVAVATRCDAIC